MLSVESIKIVLFVLACLGCLEPHQDAAQNVLFIRIVPQIGLV